MREQKIVCVDFDGVIHSYVSGWQGADVATDPPVEGAIEWIRAMVLSTAGSGGLPAFRVAVFSSRSAQSRGIRAMREYLLHHGLSELVVEAIWFPEYKPPAHIFIDDRALRFDGRWPTPSEVETFRPWWKRSQASGNVSVEAEGGNVSLQLDDHRFVLPCEHARTVAGMVDRVARVADWKLSRVPERELVVVCGLPFSGLGLVARFLGGVRVDVEVVRETIWQDGEGIREGGRGSHGQNRRSAVRHPWRDRALQVAEIEARKMVRYLWESGSGRIVVSGFHPRKTDRDEWAGVADVYDAVFHTHYVATSLGQCLDRARESGVRGAEDMVREVESVFEPPRSTK